MSQLTGGESTIKLHRSYFGDRLAEHRKDKNVTPKELRAKLVNMGLKLHISTIYKYESGERHPTPEFVYKVARCLELDEQKTRELAVFCCFDLMGEFLSEFNDQATVQGGDPLRWLIEPADLVKE